jgi:hypothetical protein
LPRQGAEHDRKTMTVDYSSEGRMREFGPPLSLASCVQLRGGQAKLFHLRVNLLHLREMAYAMPQHRPKQHVVCVHHKRPADPIRSASGRAQQTGDHSKRRHCFFTRRCADQASSRMNDAHRILTFSYLVFDPSYLAELALASGIDRPLDFIPTFATPDPFLHEITAALTSAPRDQGSGSEPLC